MGAVIGYIVGGRQGAVTQEGRVLKVYFKLYLTYRYFNKRHVFKVEIT
jgi:hypothetical protein